MARDNALPFGESLARVHRDTQTPITPAVVIGVIAALILVVNIGQPKIFTVLTSIAVIMIYLAYLMVTGPLLMKRLRGQWPPADLAAGGFFTMGRWGLLVNVVAVLWGAGMARSVAALQRLTARVVVLRDTPHAPFDVPACISWDPAHAAGCGFRRAPGGHSDSLEYAAERAAGVPGQVYADPTAAVCPFAVCPAVVSGVIVYRDDNHVTAAFAALRWRQFAASLGVARARPPF
jgi:amino acid transporter